MIISKSGIKRLFTGENRIQFGVYNDTPKTLKIDFQKSGNFPLIYKKYFLGKFTRNTKHPEFLPFLSPIN
jgi:hypothetical protein